MADADTAVRRTGGLAWRSVPAVRTSAAGSWHGGAALVLSLIWTTSDQTRQTGHP